MKKALIILFSIVLFLTACGNNKKSGKGIATLSPTPLKPLINLTLKPIFNVYVENSGSMNGYVKGVTEFEQSVYNYLTDIKISGLTDSLNLFYINSKVIPQGSNIEDFILKLEPSTFKEKGGNLGTSDISNVLKSILNQTKKNEVSILATDGIFSPGKGKDADEYLVNQQIGIKSSMSNYLKNNPNTAILIYRLSSKFDGYYYNKEDEKKWIISQRPFYLWIIGSKENLKELRKEVPENKFKGSGVQNIFSITSGDKDIKYAIKMGSGNFDLDKKSPKNTIKNLKKDTKGRQNEVRFSVNANLSGFLLGNNYILNTDNYYISSKDFNMTIANIADNQFGYTHNLKFTSANVHKGVLSIILKSKIPEWVDKFNDDIGEKPIEGKTYGIKYLINGIYEAFTFNSKNYTEIKININ